MDCLAAQFFTDFVWFSFPQLSKSGITSYIKNPAIHVKSSSNPKLLGGPFVNAPLSWIYSPLLPFKSEREHGQSRRSHANGTDSAFECLQTVGANTAYVYAFDRGPWLKYFMALEPTDDDPHMVEIRKFVAAA